MDQPLAYRMRPRTIDEIIGQKHLVGPGKIIQRMVIAKRLSSMILYGPPGIGKTSIASALAGSSLFPFFSLNAATDGKKDLEQVVKASEKAEKVILLLDEIHRLNKIKQDFLLPHLEKGTIILVGATTENPYISINPAIRSRAQIFELKPLTSDEVVQGLQRALDDPDRGLGQYPVKIDAGVLNYLGQISGGDIRTALNALELAVLSTPKAPSGQIQIDQTIIEECLQRKRMAHDKDGDAHYDTISAFQKSIRGSDVDAALYYLAILLEAGELIIACRRLLVIAYEDIGLGNPSATQRTVAAVEAAEKLGLPEARIPLAFATVELALSPKSNSTYQAINLAMQDVQAGKIGTVPSHLRDSHYKGSGKLGRGLEYLYPHNYPGHWVKQDYLPDNLLGTSYFSPSKQSKYEENLSLIYEKIQSARKTKQFRPDQS